MARPRYPQSEPLPPPLPPETRTVGQLVAESIQLYRHNFWRALGLGLGPALGGVALAAVSSWTRLAFALTGGAVLMTASYIGASLLVSGRRPEPRAVLLALAAGWLVFLPVPFLYSLFVLPVVAWLALVGLAVPVALAERVGIGRALQRAVALARADYVHAIGSLATLVIAAFLSASVLFFLLRGQGDAAREVAAFLSLLVISPLVFLGGALLYVDQAARERVARPSRAA